MNRRVVPALGIAAAFLLALTGCTGAGTSAAPAPTGSAGTTASGVLPGYQDETKDQFSPLIITTLAQPSPVKGSDNKFHLAYELSVFNDAPRDATMTKVETIAGNADGTVIATRSEDEVAANTLLTADYSPSMAGTTQIPAGRTAIVLFRDAYPTEKAIPASFTHRISATFAAAKQDQSKFAMKFPDQVAQIGGAVTPGTQKPIVIGPPLVGDNWVAFNGLDSAMLNSHSIAVMPIGGRVNGTERYAIDFIRVDPAGPPVSQGIQGSSRGDPTQNSSYLAFDQPLVAVANAKVVTVVSDQPDETPNPLPEFEPPIDRYPGNEVVLDLGNGTYALYAHMKKGSAQVKVGDTVTKGQEIGRLGNSGNSTEAHLHFQLQRGPLPLTSDNLPWVIDSFTAAGTFRAGKVVQTPAPGPRTNELPLGNSVSTFPAPQK